MRRKYEDMLKTEIYTIDDGYMILCYTIIDSLIDEIKEVATDKNLKESFRMKRLKWFKNSLLDYGTFDVYLGVMGSKMTPKVLWGILEKQYPILKEVK